MKAKDSPFFGRGLKVNLVFYTFNCSLFYATESVFTHQLVFPAQHYRYVFTHQLKMINGVTLEGQKFENVFKLWVFCESEHRISPF